jgi:hypothetical protein
LTCVCGGKSKFKLLSQRTFLSSVGHIAVARRYFACPGCRGKQVPWDRWAGVDHRSLTAAARRMLTLAGTSWPFDRAQAHLKEFCHLQVSDDTIERVCQEQGERAKRWMEQSPEPVKVFEQARGLAEFSTDGVKINTTGGWREMRISVLGKRQAALPAEAKDWEKRVLNAPTVRLASCAIAGCERIGAGWKRLSRRMGLQHSDQLSVIADGAKWIWDQAAKRLSKQARWCVDVYHVSQHLHDCGKALLGEGQAARDWAHERLMHALAHNGPELIERLQRERKTHPDGKRAAIDRLLNYLQDNRDSLWYRDRLQQGLPIGSGLIEGACKNIIGARLKANSARWRIRRVERIGALRCLDGSGLWESYWTSKAA